MQSRAAAELRVLAAMKTHGDSGERLDSSRLLTGRGRDQARLHLARRQYPAKIDGATSAYTASADLSGICGAPSRHSNKHDHERGHNPGNTGANQRLRSLVSFGPALSRKIALKTEPRRSLDRMFDRVG
jgi:hypothetical protein